MSAKMIPSAFRHFSEIGFMSGISQTDWSWTPLVADFDNDGYRDLIVTNGFPRMYRTMILWPTENNPMAWSAQKTDLDQIPKVKIHNYAFRNNGDLTFNDETTAWGLSCRLFPTAVHMRTSITTAPWIWSSIILTMRRYYTEILPGKKTAQIPIFSN